MLHGLLRLCSRDGESLCPNYFGERDYAWLEGVLAVLREHAGGTHRQLQHALEVSLRARCPKWKLRWLVHVLERRLNAPHSGPLSPRALRRMVFHVAASTHGRSAAIERASALSALEPEQLEQALFADLGRERRVSIAGLPGAPNGLAALANRAIVCALLRHAVELELEVWGDPNPVICAAKRAALLMSAGYRNHETVRLELFAPAALGAHLGSCARGVPTLLSSLPLCSAFELTARCALPGFGSAAHFVLRSGDAALGDGASQAPHSAVRRLVQKLTGCSSHWGFAEMQRAVRCGAVLLTPDLCARSRSSEGVTVYVEFLRTWTAALLATKRVLWRESSPDPVLFCVQGGPRTTALDAPDVVQFTGAVAPRIVLRKLDRLAASA